MNYDEEFDQIMKLADQWEQEARRRLKFIDELRKAFKGFVNHEEEKYRKEKENERPNKSNTNGT